MFESLKTQTVSHRDRPSAAKVLPNAIVDHIVGKDLLARLKHTDGCGLALILKVPSQTWCGLIENALDARFRHTVMISTVRQKRRSSSNRKDEVEELLKALGSGLSAINASPEEAIAAEFHTVTDHVLEIEGLDVKMVRRVIRKVTGKYARGLKQEHLTGVGPYEAMAAIGSGSSAEDRCIGFVDELQSIPQPRLVDAGCRWRTHADRS